MMMVQMNNKSLMDRGAKSNCHILHENKQAVAANGGKVAGQGSSEEHESRINLQDNNNNNDDNDDDDDDDNKNQNDDSAAQTKTRQRTHGNLVRWDKFLPFRSLKVLLVENDDSTRHVVSALLRNCGYDVKAVETGKQAWSVIEDLTSYVDLVLSEVVMPCLSGIGLLGKITSNKTFKNIPVIMMSAHDSRSIVFKCLSKGAVDFLVKPIRKNMLKNLWQHVWRKYQISSGASGSESGIWIEKSMKLRIEEDSDNHSGSNGEDDTESIGLNFRNDSDSGAQSSWTTRAVDIDSPQPMSPENQFASPASTCAPSTHLIKEPFGNNWANENERNTSIGKNDDLDKKFMGKDLRIGICGTPSFQLEDAGENGLTNTTGASKDKYLELNLNKDGENFEKRDLDLNTEQPDEENTLVVDLLGVSTNGSNTRVESSPHDIPNGLSNGDFMTEKDIHDNTEIPFFEVILKRPRDVQDNATSAHDRNVLRHSDLSAFSRYNSGSTANQAPTGNVGSCSPVDNNSDAGKTESAPNIQSDSNGTPPNQRSNGSSNNNDMGSTTNNAFTKQVSFADKPTTKILSSSAFPQAHDGQPSLQLNIQGSSQSGSSKALRVVMDGNASAHSMHKSPSGSKHGSNGHKRSGAASSSRGKKSDNGAGKGGSANGNRSEDDANRFALREAALKRFRQKRQERCFEKKVRYQSRKTLAEQRPRIRGQFIRKGMYENKGKGIDYEPNPTPQ